MRFSDIEKQHLLKAWVAISVAFALLYSSIFSLDFPIYLGIMLMTVGLGFLLHEIAHKYVALRYGCYAEFRADDKMLLLAIAFSFFGFVFAAPGAVMIMGNINKEKNGKISIAGPAANLILSVAFLLVGLLNLPFIGMAVSYGMKTNAWLALFNMIPVGNFDGRKIMEWNKPAYFSVAGISLFLVITSLIGLLPGQ
jgi:Zn-dependent protease